MFDKIWYPDEMLVAASRVGTSIFLAPILVLSFFVSFEVIIAIFGLMILLGSVVRVRGAMTLELDEEDADIAKEVVARRKRVAFGMGIPLVVVLFVTYLLIPKGFFDVLPIVAASIILIILSLMGFAPKATLKIASFVTVLAILVSLIHSWKLAAFTAAILLVFSFPECMAIAIKKDRLLKGDLQRKLPPSAAQALDQEEV